MDFTSTNKVSIFDAYKNPIGSENGSINTSEYFLRIAEGKIPGSKIVHKFGKNTDVGTSFETIWNGGGAYSGFNATEAESVTIVSDSELDTAGGTGLRTLRLYGLDENLLEQTEDIELDGLTPVTSTLSYLRLDISRGLTAGTTGQNQGDITIAQSITTANIFAVLPAGYNATTIGAYTIPAGKNGYILTQAVSLANKQSAFISARIKIRMPGSVFTTSGEATLNAVGTSFIERKFTVPIKIPPGTDLFIEAEADSPVAVSCFLDILLVDVE